MQTLRVPAGLVKSVVTQVTPEARRLVRAVFHARPHAPGLTSHEIYAAIQEVRPNTHPAPRHRLKMPPLRARHAPEFRRFAMDTPDAEPEPDAPADEHPVRSLRYLKKYVLEDMAERAEVVKVLVRKGRGGTDAAGAPLDLVRAKDGFSIAVPSAGLPGDAWMWRYLTGEQRAERLAAVEKAAPSRAAKQKAPREGWGLAR